MQPRWDGDMVRMEDHILSKTKKQIGFRKRVPRVFVQIVSSPLGWPTLSYVLLYGLQLARRGIK